MKFLCDQCKAKYQIADEKVQGKTLKMKCRKCGHIIEIRAGEGSASVPPPAGGPTHATMQLSSLDENEAAAITKGISAGNVSAPTKPTAPARPAGPPPRATASAPTPRPLAPTAAKPSDPKSPAKQADPKPAPKQESALTSAFSRGVGGTAQQPQTHDSTSGPRPGSASSDMPAEEWYCAIDGVPVGPIRLTELRMKYAQGAVTGESLVWREGYEEWRPLITLPDLHQLVREESSVAGAPPRGSVSGSAPARGRTNRTSNRPMAASPAAPVRGGNSNVIPFSRGNGAAARKLDELHEDDEVTRIAEAPSVAFDAGASALAKAGISGGHADPKISGDPFASDKASSLVAAGGAGSLGTSALAGGPAKADFETTRSSIVEGIRVVKKGLAGHYVALIAAVCVLASIVVTVKLVKPTVVHEKEVQVVEKPGETVVVYRDRDPVPGASVSAEPTKAAVKAPTSPAKSAETAATAAPTVAAGSHEYQPPVPGAGPGGPGDPPLPGSGPASGEQLDTGAVSSVVAAKKVGIRRRCIDSATGGTDGVAVTLYLDIQPDGSVASASPTQTKGDSSIGACLAREARNWRFPTSGAGRKVNVPFIFGAGG